MKTDLRFSCLFPVTCCLFLLISCKSAEKEVPVTAQEASAFAKQLQSSVEKRNGSFFDNAFDTKKFLKKAGLTDEGDAKAFGRGLSEKMNLGTQIIASLSEDGTYQLVKQYEKEGKQHVLFRLFADGSLNYHDIELAKSGKEIKIADIYIYTSGELFSETINNLYKQIKGMMGKGGPSPDDDWLRKMPDMRRLMNDGKHEEALEIYEKLPGKIQKLKAVQLMHIILSSELDDNDRYAAAIEEYQQLFPNEPNMHLVLIDGYILKKEYDKALNSVNEMDKMIDKDPFLDYYRYLMYNLKEDKANALKYIEALVKNMPDFQDGVLELILTYREEGQNEKADALIKDYRGRSSFNQRKLEQVLAE